MPKDRARAKLACRIARVDPDRFNELAATGHFPCAPRTTPGAARIFDVNDILTLIVFRRLTGRGFLPSMAGPLACEMRYFLRDHPEADKVFCVWDIAEHPLWLLPEHVTPEATHISGLDIISKEEWSLAPMRKFILHELNEEDRIAGED